MNDKLKQAEKDFVEVDAFATKYAARNKRINRRVVAAIALIVVVVVGLALLHVI